MLIRNLFDLIDHNFWLLIVTCMEASIKVNNFAQVGTTTIRMITWNLPPSWLRSLWMAHQKVCIFFSLFILSFSFFAFFVLWYILRHNMRVHFYCLWWAWYTHLIEPYTPIEPSRFVPRPTLSLHDRSGVNVHTLFRSILLLIDELY